MARMLMVLMTFTLVIVSSLQSMLENPDEVHSVCGEDGCGRVSYEDLLNRYPGMMLTETEANELETTNQASREKMLNNEGGYQNSSVIRGDGDMCCTTELRHTIKYTLANLAGVVRSLIHMPKLSPPRYQFVPQGRCIEYGWRCTGRCVLEPRYLTLLVYDPLTTNYPPIKFDTFEVPGYCSCKNSSPKN